jgi:hypothetical protein
MEEIIEQLYDLVKTHKEITSLKVSELLNKPVTLVVSAMKSLESTFILQTEV